MLTLFQLLLQTVGMVFKQLTNTVVAMSIDIPILSLVEVEDEKLFDLHMMLKYVS